MRTESGSTTVDQWTSATPLRVWITGAGGLIGNALLQSASSSVPGWQVYGTTRHQVDLTDARAVRKTFQTIQPDVIIHCAALTKTATCDLDPAQARTINVDMTERLLELADKIRFVFFSTDLVFDGRAGYYDETADINPLSVYGETKVQAERLVLMNPQHTVIRTSLNGGSSPTGDRGFNEELRRAWEAGQTVNLFTDEFRCPISARVTVRALWELIEQNHTGLYHIAGTERLSRWQIGQLLAPRSSELNPKLEPASRLTYTGPPRPADTSLNCAKAQQLLLFPLPGLTEWLTANPEEIF
ncbi:MAG: SDR family oxidoreductase [Nitrospirales bacterium]|nr:SDR family oxidoreductase [Nitrospirales bacterium]